MNFTLQPFAKETLTGPQRAWSSRDNIHTQFCFMKRSDHRQTIDITCKDTEHLAGLHIEMQSKMGKDKACLLMRQTKVQISSKALQALKE